MCDKRVVTLRRLVERPPGPTGPEPPAPTGPPPPPSSHDYILNKAANQNHKVSKTLFYIFRFSYFFTNIVTGQFSVIIKMSLYRILYNIIYQVI